jgi:ketosteroid isomerase-like protein
MTDFIFAARLLRRSTFALLCILLSASPLRAQGIMDVIVPKANTNPMAVYHAKVREKITTVLQQWAKSLERRDTTATASAYTANARSLIGDEPEAVSASAIVQQLYKTRLTGNPLEITVNDFDMSGDIAFVSTLLIAPSEHGDSVPTIVRSLFVFRYDDWRDRWQVREQFIDWRAPTESSPASGR